MFEAPATAGPARPDPADMRPLTCTRCYTAVEVFEIPDRYIDPASFVCGDCQLGAA